MFVQPKANKPFSTLSSQQTGVLSHAKLALPPQNPMGEQFVPTSLFELLILSKIPKKPNALRASRDSSESA
jgi:hypothetical protein